MNDTQATPATNHQRSQDYPIYKPNSRGTGGVIRFGLNRSKAAVFIDAASQSGERQFDWENKITMKWGLSDIGTMLATLQGKTTQTKLFHQTDRANSAFEFNSQSDPERAPYRMTLSRQDASDQSIKKISISVTHSEAAVLETALRAAICQLIQW